MELITKLSWFGLGAVHILPAAVLFAPKLTQYLYEISPDADVGLLIIHRGALFLAILCICLFAAFDLGVRRAASVVVAISVLGFLFVYARAGFPEGALRTIAIADVAATLPLALVTYQAWWFYLRKLSDQN